METPFSTPPRQPKNIFSADGRIGRMTYFAWLFLNNIVFSSFFSILLVVFLAFSKSGYTFSNSSIPFIIIIPVILVACVALYLAMVFTIRRLHDLNHSGWLCLLLFVPFVGTLFQLYIYFAKGNQEANQFGLPRPTQAWEKVITWIGVILSVIMIVFLGFFYTSVYNGYMSGSNDRAQAQEMAQLLQQNASEASTSEASEVSASEAQAQ